MESREFAPDAPPPPRGNAMGVAGFVVSLVGIVLTCGLLCPLGLIFSLVGLGRQPRGLAVAGTIIGGLGTLFIAGMIAITVAGFGALNLGTFKTAIALAMVSGEIESYRREHGRFPDEEEGGRIVAGRNDGWGHPFRYTSLGDGYSVRSAGPDGTFDTADDLKHP